jgi:hypothetical protein
MDTRNISADVGDEIRVMSGATQLFGGYVTTREQQRRGADSNNVSANFECQDYNSIMDRIVVPSYTIDAGDADSVEIETLRATYLAGIGVTAGDIDTVDASMEELELAGTFRQCMEAICAAVGGAHFYINADKELNYTDTPSSWALTGVDNLSDDLSVANSHPYRDFSNHNG